MSTDGILKHAADVLAERSKTYGEPDKAMAASHFRVRRNGPDRSTL